MARTKNATIDEAVELTLRLVKCCAGERIWMDEHNFHPNSDLDRREIAAGARLARELELRDVKTEIRKMGREKCFIRVTANIARTMLSVKTDKVSADVKLEKWDGKWYPDEADINFRRERECHDFDGFEGISLPPLLPVKPHRVPNEKSVTVTFERYTDKLYGDEMLIRVEGGYGFGGDGGQNDFDHLLCGIRGMKTIMSPRLVGVEKDEDVEWATITPMLREKITEFFGVDVAIVEKIRDSMPEEDGMFLGETEMRSIRDCMRGCALTEDEREAIGMSRSEYEVGLEE